MGLEENKTVQESSALTRFKGMSRPIFDDKVGAVVSRILTCDWRCRLRGKATKMGQGQEPANNSRAAIQTPKWVATYFVGSMEELTEKNTKRRQSAVAAALCRRTPRNDESLSGCEVFTLNHFELV